VKFLNSLYQKAQVQGVAYTALDAMKMFAIVNMTADHIGAYFFPHDLWWRAIGRITFPVWFFLVGYSRSRALPTSLLVFAALLVADHPLVGRTIFPMNALVTVIACRLILNYCTDHKFLPRRLPELIVVFCALSLVTIPIIEYGSVAFMYALVGRMVREKEKTHFNALLISSYVIFIIWQFLGFHFDMFQGAYVVLGTAWVVWWLSRCPNDTIWPDWTKSRFKIFVTVLSRNTLPYYFYHRLLLEVLSALLLGGGIGFSLKFFG